LHGCQPKEKRLGLVTVSITCQRLWLERNNLNFNLKTSSEAIICNRINAELNLWKLGRQMAERGGVVLS
jgi:hypothetical protein